MVNSDDSLYIVMLKAQGLKKLAISVLLQVWDAAGLSNAAVQLLWATDGSSKTGMHDDNSNNFVMMMLFVYVTVLSILFADQKLQVSQMG